MNLVLNKIEIEGMVLLAGLSLTLTAGAVPPKPQTVEQTWTARWIQAPWSTERDGAEVDGSKPMPVFRREFAVRQKVTKATLRIAGLGQYEGRIGSKGEK